jgi:hypothetical protein
VNDGIEWTWKDAFLVYFKFSTSVFTKRDQEKHGNPQTEYQLFRPGNGPMTS